MEEFDIYDINRIRTGRTAMRGDALKNGEFRLVVHVCIFNSRGELLIQKRQSTKNTWADLWDVSVGGGALAGECSTEAAERETEEEIGLKIDLHGQRPRMTVNFREGFNDVYIIRRDVRLEELILQEDEVSDVRWADRETILQMMDRKEFIPYYKGFIQWIFEAQVPRALFDANRS